MEILYKADDGTIFNNEFECLHYEQSKEHFNLKDIAFYTDTGNKVEINPNNIFDDSLYEKTEKLVVHNEKEVQDLFWLTDYCGWVEWEEITSPGTWIRREEDFGNAHWEKVD